MCGFVGVHRVDGGSVDARQLAGLADLLTHRGPDGHGCWVGDGVGLAHRRLAIIDPSGSPQPMASVDDRLHIAFNGEILNYKQLRAQLDYPFETDGDTETLLALFDRWGTASVPKLRGQFAFAVHDGVEGETWLVRDRLGILPLYHVARPGWVAFASEIKALLPLLDDCEVDEVNLDLYLRRRAVPAPGTLFAGVQKLLPGHIARIDRRGRMHLTRYWSPDDVADRSVDDDEARRLVEGALSDAIDDNLVADVPVGAYLSGGLDSSLVAALAARRVGAEMHTFSAGFGDARHDELPFARQVNAVLGTRHHEVEVRPDDFESLWRTLTWHRDAPLSEPADIAVYQLACAASEHVKVVLSGEGADEVFAGYPKHRMARLNGLPWPRPALRGFDLLQRHAPPRLARARQGLRAIGASTEAARLEAWFAPFTASERSALLGHRVGHERLLPPPPTPSVGGPLRRMLTADCGAWLSDNLLERGDRMTMAASVELRPPFLDHRLVELGLSLPDRVRIRRGSGKWILRQIGEGLLPPEILDRRKVGFRVPLDRWFRTGLREFAWDALLSPSSFVGQVFNRMEVEALLSRHEHNRQDEQIRIWTLLSLEIWHRASFSRTDRPATEGLTS